VLEAMEVPLEDAMGTIRLSTGRGTSAGEIDRALDEITKVVESLQPSGLAGATASAALGKDVKLTRYTHGLGCACKLRPQLLEGILLKMPPPSDERILVGSDTADDAAVFKISDDTAIVQTVDFFTPILDDPFQFGAVAAANSLSDIYAMGARPLFALNIVGFPSNRLPMSVLEEILRGAQSKADEAGISIIGGHTIDDTEPKYGMAVTGMASPDQILANRGAKPGDALVLTKPIGTGVLSTAMKQDMLDSEGGGCARVHRRHWIRPSGTPVGNVIGVGCIGGRQLRRRAVFGRSVRAGRLRRRPGWHKRQHRPCVTASRVRRGRIGHSSVASQRRADVRRPAHRRRRRPGG
jgi:hypothetical protein